MADEDGGGTGGFGGGASYYFGGDFNLNFGNAFENTSKFSQAISGITKKFQTMGTAMESAASKSTTAVTKLTAAWEKMAQDISVVVLYNDSLIDSFKRVAEQSKMAADNVSSYSRALGVLVQASSIAQKTLGGTFTAASGSIKKAQGDLSQFNIGMADMSTNMQKIYNQRQQSPEELKILQDRDARQALAFQQSQEDRAKRQDKLNAYRDSRNGNLFMRVLMGGAVLGQIKQFEDSVIEAKEKNDAFRMSLESMGVAAEKVGSIMENTSKYERMGFSFDQIQESITKITRSGAPLEATLERAVSLSAVSGKTLSESTNLLQSLYAGNKNVGRQLLSQFKIPMDDLRKAGLIGENNAIVIRNSVDRDAALDVIDNFNKSRGASDLLEKRNTSLAGSFTALNARIEEAKIALGDHFAPAVVEANRILGTLIDKLKNDTTDTEKGAIGAVIFLGGSAAKAISALTPLIYTLSMLSTALKGVELGAALSGFALITGELVVAAVTIALVTQRFLMLWDVMVKGKDPVEDLDKTIENGKESWDAYSKSLNGTNKELVAFIKHNKEATIQAQATINAKLVKDLNPNTSNLDSFLDAWGLGKRVDEKKTEADLYTATTAARKQNIAAKTTGDKGQILSASQQLEFVADRQKEYADILKGQLDDSGFDAYAKNPKAYDAQTSAFMDSLKQRYDTAMQENKRLKEAAKNNRDDYHIKEAGPTDRASKARAGAAAVIEKYEADQRRKTSARLDTDVKNLTRGVSRGTLSPEKALAMAEKILATAKQLKNQEIDINKLLDDRVKYINAAHKEELQMTKDQQSLLSSLGKLTPQREEGLIKQNISSTRFASMRRGYVTEEDKKELREYQNQLTVLAHTEEVIRKESRARIIGIEQGKYAQQKDEVWKFQAELRKAGYNEETIARLTADHVQTIDAEARMERLKYEQSLSAQMYAHSGATNALAKSQLDERIREGQGEDLTSYNGKSMTNLAARKQERSDEGELEIGRVKSEAYYQKENLKEKANLDPVAARFLNRDLAEIERKVKDDEAKIREAIRIEDIKQNEEDQKIIRDAAIKASQIRTEILTNRNNRIVQTIKDGKDSITGKELTAEEMQRNANKYFRNSKTETASALDSLSLKRDEDLVNATGAQKQNIEAQYQEDVLQLRLKQLDAVKSITSEIEKQKQKEKGDLTRGDFTMGKIYGSLDEAMAADKADNGFGSLEGRKKRLEADDAKTALRSNEYEAGIDPTDIANEEKKNWNGSNGKDSVKAQQDAYNKRLGKNFKWNSETHRLDYNWDNVLAGSSEHALGGRVGNRLSNSLGVDSTRIKTDRTATPEGSWRQKKVEHDKNAIKMEGEITVILKDKDGKELGRNAGQIKLGRGQKNPNVPGGGAGLGNS